MVALSMLFLMPANGPSYNRLWQALMVPPDDLMMRPIVSSADFSENRLHDVTHLRLVTTPAISYVLGATFFREFSYSKRSIGQSIAQPLHSAIAIALSTRLTSDADRSFLIHDPLASDPSAWTALGGSPPEFVTGIKDFRASSTALQNPAGGYIEVFTSELIPIDPAREYRVEWSVRQPKATSAMAYLAIAWYDDRGRWLVSNVPSPEGGGNPVGWVNGIYSYFGLVGFAAPTVWTTYRTSFGPDQAASIPCHARFARVGAQLNYNRAPGATIQMTNIRLWQTSKSEMIENGVFPRGGYLLVVAPLSRIIWTYASQAGRASHHWPANEVAADLAGGVELAAAARALGGTPVDRDNTMFELHEISDSPARVP
jgi:hypothetical protein